MPNPVSIDLTVVADDDDIVETRVVRRRRANQDIVEVDRLPHSTPSTSNGRRNRRDNRNTINSSDRTTDSSRQRPTSNRASPGRPIPVSHQGRHHDGDRNSLANYINSLYRNEDSRTGGRELFFEVVNRSGVTGSDMTFMDHFTRMLTNAIPTLVAGRVQDDEQLQRAVYLSSLHPQPRGVSVDQIKSKPDVPTTTLEGYTRSLNSNVKPLCAYCDTILGDGINEEEAKEKKCSDTDVLLSKRVFFLRCGHVYCGRCVVTFLARKTSQNLPKSCVADGCKTSFRRSRKKSHNRNVNGGFAEIYY